MWALRALMPRLSPIEGESAMPLHDYFGSRRDAKRVDARILIVFLLISVALFLFLKFASEVAEGDTMAFDRAVITGLRDAADASRPLGPDWLPLAVRDVTALGGWVVLTVLTGVVVGFLSVTRKTAIALFVVGAVAGGAVVSALLKLAFNRARPDIVPHLVDVTSTSFPSGHAMNSAIVYLTLGALLARTQQARGVRVYILAIAILLTLSVGASRVYLGVHWPSDVVAGWIVGATWATGCSLLARRLQHRHKLEPAEGPA